MQEKKSAQKKIDPNLERHKTYAQFHVLVYCAAVAIWSILHVLFPKGWSVFWFMVFWGMAALMHYLAVRAMSVDEDWVKERSEDISYNATDLGHIEAIRKGYDNRASNIARKFEQKRDDKPSDKSK